MQNIDSNSVKKKAVVVFVLIAFVCGFLAGIIYCAFETPSTTIQPTGSQSAGQSLQTIQQQADKILVLEQELDANPENVATRIELGDIYFDSNKFQEAIEVFSKAEQIDPGNIHVLNDLGTLYLNTGNYDAALTRFETVLGIDPSHSHSLYYVGIIHREKGDKDKALQAFEKVLNMNPDPQLAGKAQQEIAALKGELLPQ